MVQSKGSEVGVKLMRKVTERERVGSSGREIGGKRVSSNALAGQGWDRGLGGGVFFGYCGFFFFCDFERRGKGGGVEKVVKVVKAVKEGGRMEDFNLRGQGIGF